MAQACKLCGREAKLCKAHIVPKAFWPVKNGGGTPKLLDMRGDRFPKKSPAGVYDPSILCASCDGNLGRWDQHASETLLSGSRSVISDQGNEVGWQYPDGDPDVLKLFAISIAWRSSISSHEIYSHIDLGPYEAACRSSVLKETDTALPGQPACIILSEWESEMAPMFNPWHWRFDGIRFFVVPAGRFLFLLKFNKRRPPKGLSEVSMQSGRTVTAVKRSWHGTNDMRMTVNGVRAGFNRGAFPKVRS